MSDRVVAVVAIVIAVAFSSAGSASAHQAPPRFIGKPIVYALYTDRHIGGFDVFIRLNRPLEHSSRGLLGGILVDHRYSSSFGFQTVSKARHCYTIGTDDPLATAPSRPKIGDRVVVKVSTRWGNTFGSTTLRATSAFDPRAAAKALGC